MFVDMVRWPRVGALQWRNVWRPVLPLGLVSSSDRQKAVFPPRRGICFFGEPGCIVTEVLHGLSCLSAIALIRLCYIDLIEVSIKSSHAGPELGQYGRFFLRQAILQQPGVFAWQCGIYTFRVSSYVLW
ncbi:unnamed protein product [Penicillium salamii]|nr:unnamed protein product [Penicillium salamii]